jgi:nitroimidazol reductase NimA-like FMN-containing flavoprotein (pyridoxamine 5'-phosphate oxidase superfamily)
MADEARWQELTKSECFELLAGEQIGRVAMVDEWGPIALPVNFAVDNHMVVFRTETGTKLDVAGRGERVGFEVDGIDSATQAGWSVLIRGEAIEVTEPTELAQLRALSLPAWAPGLREHYIRILPAVVTGRRISARGPDPGNRSG